MFLLLAIEIKSRTKVKKYATIEGAKEVVKRINLI
jgi:hypothetical protein